MSEAFNEDNLKQNDDESIKRPVNLKDFYGQNDLKEKLNVFISSASIRRDVLDHIIFFGPPGLGKTTLAQIVANEMGSKIKIIISTSIKKPIDIISVLASLEHGDILFIDEIHRLNKEIEETLYSAMEDFQFNVLVGEGVNARNATIPIAKFTLIGATTMAGNLTKPLRDRFGISLQLVYYTDDELAHIVLRGASKLSLVLSTDAALEIAIRSRNTPRLALHWLKRLRDFAVHDQIDVVDVEYTKAVLLKLGVDENGLNSTDRNYINIMTNKFHGGPVSLKTMSEAMGESVSDVENSIEPFLIRKGLIKRTSRGRVLNKDENHPNMLLL